MQSRPDALRRSDLILLIAAFALTALYALAAGGNFSLDDSWIHQTYARNLAQTGQWAFVPGVPSAASTSPLYTVVLAVGYWLNIPFRLWAHGLGALMLAFTGMIGRRIANRLAPESRGIGLITGLTLIGAWHLLWAAASGMETPIFAMFTLLLIWLVLRQVTANQPSSPVPFSLREKGEASPIAQAGVARGFRGEELISAVVFGAAAALTTLTRPEGVLLVGMIGVTLLIVRPSAKMLVWGMAAGIAFGIVLAPYLILNYNLTGGLLPNTAAAKRMYATPLFAQSLIWRFNVMLTPLLAGGQLLLIPGVIAFIVMLVRRDRAALIALLLPAWAFGLILLYAATLPLNFQHGRYVIPALPAWITAGVIGTAWLLRWSSGALLPRVVSRVLAISAALLFVWFVFGIGLTAHVLDVTIIEEEMVTAAHWLAENIPPEDLLAVNDIGAVGYFAPRPILDIAGLVTPEVVPIKYDNAALWTFLQENGARYLMAMADQIPGATDNMPTLCSVFSTGGTAAVRAGGTNMTIYLLDWDHALPCP